MFTHLQTLSHRGLPLWVLLAVLSVTAHAVLPEEDCPERVWREGATAAERLPWNVPPRTIPGYAGPPRDAAGSNEAKQIGHVAQIYQRLANDESSLDIFALAQSDPLVREISFHLVAQRFAIGLHAADTMEDDPFFMLEPATIQYVRPGTLAITFNPNHWETDPNLSFAKSATSLYVMDRLIRDRYLEPTYAALSFTTLEYLHDEVPRPSYDVSFRKRDRVEQLYSHLYGELCFIELYGKWSRTSHPSMRTEELDARYAYFVDSPNEYLAETLRNSLKKRGYRDNILIDLVIQDVLSNPLPAEWPLPKLPESQHN